MENQLVILSESLDQKLSVLEDIQAYNQKQEKAFLEDTPDLESFDAALEEKEDLIGRLEKLDEGFELLYARIAEQLKNQSGTYGEQIRELQEKIRRITDLSVSIQAQEARNKKLIEDYFAKARDGIRQSRQGSKAAYDYYRSMSGAALTKSHFLDQKH